MAANKKTFWPYGILCVIVFGIVLLIGLVFTSLKQVNLEDNAYMQDYKDVEKNINAFVDSTETFLQDYEVQASIAGQPLEFIPPYKQKKQNKKDKRIEIPAGAKQILAIRLTPKKVAPKIQDYKVYASRYYDRTYKDHYDILQKQDASHFVLPTQKPGRLKIILEILLPNQKVYLQQDVLIQ